VNDGVLDPQLVFFSDETWFHLHGRVNSQNNQYWSSANPGLIHGTTLYDPKVDVWYAMSANRIMGPIFPPEKPSIRADTLIAFLISFPQLTEDERHVFLTRRSYVIYRSKLVKLVIWRLWWQTDQWRIVASSISRPQSMWLLFVW